MTPLDNALIGRPHFSNSRNAKWIVHELTRKKARAHWATARKFVQVRSHALFWHAYTGKRLCAPGGKWAERDRVEFSVAFI